MSEPYPINYHQLLDEDGVNDLNWDPQGSLAHAGIWDQSTSLPARFQSTDTVFHTRPDWLLWQHATHLTLSPPSTLFPPTLSDQPFIIGCDTPHLADLGPIPPPRQQVGEITPPEPNTPDSATNTCAHPNCGEQFPSRAQLNDHARKENHKAFICHCGDGFTRSDALTRHAKSHQPERSEKIECPVCDKHDGDKAFKRRDNLLQHLKVAHRIEKKGLKFFAARGVDCLRSSQS